MRLRKSLSAIIGALIGLPVLLCVSFYLACSRYAPNRLSGSIPSDGGQRGYLLHVPPSYRPGHPTALVISLHAAGLWPGTQAALTHWDRLADREGLLVVYPAGTALNGNPSGSLPFRVWLLHSPAMLTANVRFVSDLIDTLMGHYSIDPRRVYLNGFSNGGAGVFALSCRLSARLAAVGTVSAAQDLPWMSCADTTPVPLINFHGTADLVPYTGGRSVFSPRPFPDVEQWTARWAARNHCTLGPVVASVAPDVRRASYQSCARDADVLLFTIQGGGHAWPGGKPFPVWLVGRTTMSIDATELMWAFFQQHPKPSP